MRRTIILASILLCFGCDDDPPPAEDAGTDAATPPPVDAGPFVCENPARDPATEPPVSDTPRPEELTTIDRTVDGAAGVPFDPDAIAEDGALFDLGVQSGAMTSDSAILWTHVTSPGPSTLRVWRASDTAGEVMLAVEQPADSADGGYVHSAVTGLSPATRYFYAFFTGAAAGLHGALDDRLVPHRAPGGRDRHGAGDRVDLHEPGRRAPSRRSRARPTRGPTSS